MNTLWKTTGWLIRTTLAHHSMSDVEFIERFAKQCEFSKSSFYRWRNDEVRLDNPPYAILRALAILENVPVSEMYRRLEDDQTTRINMATELDLRNFKLYPLVVGDFASPHLARSVKLGLIGRAKLCYENNLRAAQSNFELATEEARRAGETRLVTYLKIHLLKVHEMTNELQAAKQLYDDIQHDIQCHNQHAKETGDTVLATLVKSFLADAELSWLWAAYWAAGVSSQSVEKGRVLHPEIIDADLNQRLPNFYHFMARCYLALGQFDQAVESINNAETSINWLKHPSQARHELFLDAGGSLPNGLIDYTWYYDEVLAAKTDILVTAGQVAMALDAYSHIVLHGTPAAHINLHTWALERWQRYLAEQTLVTPEDDVKRGYTLDAFTEEIAETGDMRVFASNVWAHGQYLQAEGQDRLALDKYRKAKKVAEDCGAKDLVAVTALSIARLALLKHDRLLAIDNVRVVEEVLAKLDNPYLLSQLRELQSTLSPS